MLAAAYMQEQRDLRPLLLKLLKAVSIAVRRVVHRAPGDRHVGGTSVGRA